MPRGIALLAKCRPGHERAGSGRGHALTVMSGGDERWMVPTAPQDSDCRRLWDRCLLPRMNPKSDAVEVG
jgi:hypothetical protein